MNANATIAASASYPGIRMLTVDTATSTTPLDDIARAKGASKDSGWLQAIPQHETFSTTIQSPYSSTKG